MIQNAFEESISADARQSTRINFHGDKAALELEFGKNRKVMAGNNAGDTMNAGGGRHGGNERWRNEVEAARGPECTEEWEKP
jgi:hypothetical protein